MPSLSVECIGFANLHTVENKPLQQKHSYEPLQERGCCGMRSSGRFLLFPRHIPSFQTHGVQPGKVLSIYSNYIVHLTMLNSIPVFRLNHWNKAFALLAVYCPTKWFLKCGVRDHQCPAKKNLHTVDGKKWRVKPQRSKQHSSNSHKLHQQADLPLHTFTRLSANYETLPPLMPVSAASTYLPS